MPIQILSSQVPNKFNNATGDHFDIRNHLDKLAPAKRKNRFICPVCSGNNLTIDPKDGAYKCWSGGCECKDIREAISPWDETKVKSTRAQTRKPKPPTPAPIPEGSVELAKLPEPVTHPEKRKRGHRTEIEYPYSDTQWVLRVEHPSENPKGYEKATYPYHLGESGEPTTGKGDAAWNPYRIDEVEAHGAGSWVLGVEGESCVEAARYLDLVSFTLQGSAWNEGELTRAMLQCKTAGVAGMAYFPDHDDTGYKKASAMSLAAAKAQLPFIQIDPVQLWSAIPEKGDIADWVKWGMEQGWDKDEFIRRLEEQFNAAADRERQQQNIAVDQLEQNLSSGLKPARSRFNQRFQAVKELWDGRLRLNTLKQRVELDGEPLDLDFVRADLCRTLDIDIPKEEAVEIVLTIARENQYCPIVEYLERVEATYPEPNINFNNLTTHLLGTSDRLYTAYLKRHLIGSVARAFNPGCQMDTALIFQGDQGIGKSSFFRTLYSAEFFDDTMAESSDKDELMKLHQHWAVEWAEFETQLSRKGYSKLKQFMTTKVDTYRPPYGRTPKAFSRRSVLVGSTNELEFLNDPSGDRRYWVIPLGNSINLSLTKHLRDQIWAAAVAAYRTGEQWWLNAEEKQLADEANKPFRTSDTWEDFISAYIQGRQFVTIAELLDKALHLDPNKQDKGSQMRASAILRRLGWDKGKSWVDRTWKRGWVNPDRSTDPPFDGVDREFEKVDRCQESHEINAFGYTDPPDPPLDQHLPELPSLIMEAVEVTEAKTEKSLVEGGSVELEKTSEACEIKVSPTDPPPKEGDKVQAKHPQTGEVQRGTLCRQVTSDKWDVWFVGDKRPRAVKFDDIAVNASDSVRKH